MGKRRGLVEAISFTVAISLAPRPTWAESDSRYPPEPPKRYLDYRPTDPPPAGYHLVTEPHWGFIRAGAIVFGVSYLIPLAIAAGSGFSNDTGLLAIPIAGPVAYIAVHYSRPEASSSLSNLTTYSYGIYTVGQLTGLVLAGVGAGLERKRWKLGPDGPPASARVEFRPLLSPLVAGAVVRGTF